MPQIGLGACGKSVWEGCAGPAQSRWMPQSLPWYSAIPEMTQFSCITLSKIANLQQHGSCKEHREWGEGKENTQSTMPVWQQAHHLTSCWIMIVLNLKQLKGRMKVHPHFHIPTHAIDLLGNFRQGTSLLCAPIPLLPSTSFLCLKCSGCQSW